MYSGFNMVRTRVQELNSLQIEPEKEHTLLVPNGLRIQSLHVIRMGDLTPKYATSCNFLNLRQVYRALEYC